MTQVCQVTVENPLKNPVIVDTFLRWLDDLLCKNAHLIHYDVISKFLRNNGCQDPFSFLLANSPEIQAKGFAITAHEEVARIDLRDDSFLMGKVWLTRRNGA